MPNPALLVLPLALAAALAAQGTPAPTTPATPAPPAAKAPDLGDALLQKAAERTLALASGTFKSTESQDNAMLRQAGLPPGVGPEDVDVDGGWEGGLLWAAVGDGDQLVSANGRHLVKDGSRWKLRHGKLASGAAIPFVLDPRRFFAALLEAPAEARRVAHTEAAEIGGKQVAILSLQLRQEVAKDFALSGAIPAPGGGPGGMLMIGGGHAQPDIDYEVDLALFVDPSTGDLLRLRAKTYETNPMFGNVRIAVAGGPGGDAEPEAAEPEAKPDTAGKPAEFKKGLQERKPAKDQSVMYFKADFASLGTAKAPALAEPQKALLGIR